MGDQARLVTVDPWGNSVATVAIDELESPQRRRTGTDNGQGVSQSSSPGFEYGGNVHSTKSVPEIVGNSLSSPDQKDDGIVSELPPQDQDVDSDTSEEARPESRIGQEDDSKQKLLEAQANERKLIAKVEQLEGQLQQQRQRCIDLDRAWKKSTAALTQLQRQDPHEKVDDSTLRGLYNGLVFDVSNWAGSFCRGGAMRIIESKRALLQSLSPAYAAYFHDETLRPFLLQSLLMRLLVREVLNFDCGGGLWWAGVMCKALRRIQTELLPVELLANSEANGAAQLAEIREYSRWKAKGALLVGKRAKQQAIETGIGRVVSKFKQDLYMFVPGSCDEVWTDLREIVSKAVKLDEEMNKSRAVLTIRDWEEEDFSRMKFDEASMESEVGFAAAQFGMAVELVLAPALFKMGTADGEAYDQTSYLSKWTVICSESRKR